MLILSLLLPFEALQATQPFEGQATYSSPYSGVDLRAVCTAYEPSREFNSLPDTQASSYVFIDKGVPDLSVSQDQLKDSVYHLFSHGYLVNY